MYHWMSLKCAFIKQKYRVQSTEILEAWLINLETFTALLDKCAFIEESQISLYFAEYRNIYYTIRKKVMNIEIFIIPLDKCKVCIYRRISILLNMEIFIITLDWINAN